MWKFFTELKKEAAIECTCTGKTSAGATTPHLVPLIDVRLAIHMVSEIGADDKLSEDFVKDGR